MRYFKDPLNPNWSDVSIIGKLIVIAILLGMIALPFLHIT